MHVDEITAKCNGKSQRVKDTNENETNFRSQIRKVEERLEQVTTTSTTTEIDRFVAKIIIKNAGKKIFETKTKREPKKELTQKNSWAVIKF